MIVHSIESWRRLTARGCGMPFSLPAALRCAPIATTPTHGIPAPAPSTPRGAVTENQKIQTLLQRRRRVTFGGGEPLLQAGEIVRLGRLLAGDNISYTIDTSGCVELDGDVRAALRGAGLVICDLKFPDAQTFKKYTGGDFSRVLKFFDFLATEKIRTWARTVIVPGINDQKEDSTATLRSCPYVDAGRSKNISCSASIPWGFQI